MTMKPGVPYEILPEETKMNLAPIHITFMMACYTSLEPEAQLGERHWNSPGGKETRSWLIQNELIDGNNRATDRGEAWVRFICDTPLPEKKWVRPDNVHLRYPR